jgi:phosphate transport system permease protein
MNMTAGSESRMSHPRSRQNSGSRLVWRKGSNTVMLVLTSVACVIAIVPLVWILSYVVLQGASEVTLSFLTSLPTPVGVPGGGIANALIGSAITVGLAVVGAVPVAVLAAIYIAARPNTPLGLAVRFGTDVISGVPSIVMGIFAYALIVVPQKHFSAFSAAAVLSFIMLPTIIRTTEEMLKLVPVSLREASLALGAPEWRTSLAVMLPAAANGILTGVMLAIARAAGEAAPMLFTAFGNPFFNTRLDQPIATLPQMIFVYAVSPYQDWRAKAWATALVLIVLVLALNVFARLFSAWRARKLGNVTR